MKRLVIALVGAVVIIGVETYLLMKPAPPIPAPVMPNIVVVPPAPTRSPVALVQPKPKQKRKILASAPSQASHKAPNLGRMMTGESRPFVMPTGGIFSGVDPQDPRIYHFNEE